MSTFPRVLGLSRELSSPVPPTPMPTGVERVIAHRGGAALRPENTRAAFDFAYSMGVRVLETDVQVTADGVAICFHDDRLERMTGLAGRPEDYTWAQLSEAVANLPERYVEAGMVADGSAAGPGVTTEPLMLMEDLLADYPDASFIVDVKTIRGVRALAAAINRTGSASRTCVTHSWDSWLEALREMTSPELRRGLGWETLAELVRCARAGERPDPSIRVANYAHIGWETAGELVAGDPEFLARFVEFSHELDMAVRVWTINDVDRMRYLWDAGADAIFTDRPDLALAELARR